MTHHAMPTAAMFAARAVVELRDWIVSAPPCFLVAAALASLVLALVAYGLVAGGSTGDFSQCWRCRCPARKAELGPDGLCQSCRHAEEGTP